MYAQSLTTTAQSAISTLQILDRQARKDAAKTARFCKNVYAVLNSPEAIKTYKMLWNAAVLVGMVAIASAKTARNWLDQSVEVHLAPVAVEPPASPAPVAQPEPVAAVEPPAKKRSAKKSTGTAATRKSSAPKSSTRKPSTRKPKAIA